MKYKITLNNKVYEVEVEAGQAMLLDEYEVSAPAAPVAPAAALVAAPVAAAPAAPAAAAPTAAGEVVESPMPGTILAVKVSQGQTVKSGDILVVLDNPGSRPADLRAIYSLLHTTDPARAKPWMPSY
ncbi:MAG: biotin/lipoyl-binding protein, partial [Oscillospiraceae bacterium]|nr:biotin/lipoyl-binding protein [Oscillospiraceae bacterium]